MKFVVSWCWNMKVCCSIKHWFAFKKSILSGFCLLALLSCVKKPKETQQVVAEQATVETGEALAKTYCGTCHLYPSPNLLDKKTWQERVLPNMGYRFGIYKDRTRDSLLEKGIGGRIVDEAGIFPTKQMIPDEKWELIKKFYRDNAPEKLLTKNDKVLKTLSLFKPIIPGFKITRPAVTAITYHKDSKVIYLADCSLEDHSTINILDKKLTSIATLGLPHPVANMTVLSDTLYVLMIGHLIPSDEPAGTLIKALKNNKGEYIGYALVLKHLKRPVDIAYADLDKDGDDDILVCEYGNHTGGVSLFVKQGKNKYTKKVLSSSPGAIRVVIEDINKDSYKDIVVLMAQGDEGIDVFFNQGNGQFKKERLLRFPPVYGSVSFSLTDVNLDGYLDIVYVNGDNADVSPVLKPYHGIRLFLNDQHNKFKESYFYPLYGAYKAIVRDFDQDGDIDIAAIAFFPDFINNPEQGFVYLENTTQGGKVNFAATTFPGSEKGRWITMTEGDVDNDGDADLLLGSFTSMSISGDTTGVIGKKYFSDHNTLLILKNTHTQR